MWKYAVSPLPLPQTFPPAARPTHASVVTLILSRHSRCHFFSSNLVASPPSLTLTLWLWAIFLATRDKLLPIMSMPFLSALSVTSDMTTWKPTCAAACAIPAPMRPAPKTVICLTSPGPALVAMDRREEDMVEEVSLVSDKEMEVVKLREPRECCELRAVVWAMTAGALMVVDRVLISD